LHVDGPGALSKITWVSARLSRRAGDEVNGLAARRNGDRNGMTGQTRRKQMSRRTVAPLFAALALLPQLAFAEAGGDNACANLAKADRAAQPFDDQVYSSKIEYFENKRLVKTFELEIVTKGLHKMLIDFKAPGDVRGMRILILDAETMYTYLPQFRRVRRIAANARNQGFMGTNISNEDMGEQRFSDRWNCTPVKTTPDEWTLDLTPRPNITSGYTKLRVKIGRKGYLYRHIEMYQDTRVVKTQFRENFQTMEGLEMATRIRYVSADRPAESRITLTSWRVNTGVADSEFTQRALLRGD
jgi:outer membrane lipoprotein-sorting protein